MSATFSDQTAGRIIEQVRWAEQFPRTRNPALNRPFSFGTNEWWPCQSQASSDCPAFGIAAVVDITTLAGDDRPIILIDQPSTTFRRQYVVINQDGVAANSYGACSFGPRVRVAYDSSATPAFDDGWGPKPGQWTITKIYPSAISIVGVADSAAKHAFGRLDVINLLLGKVITSAISAGGSGTMEIYTGDWATDTGVSLTVYDPRTTGNSLAVGHRIGADFRCGRWILIDLDPCAA